MKLVETKLETRVNEAFLRVAVELLPDELRQDDLTVWLLNTLESTKVDAPQRFPALGFEVNWSVVIATATQNSLYFNTHFYLTSLLRIGRLWRVSELAAEAAQNALEPHNLRQTVLANLESYIQVLREMNVAPDHQHTFLSDSIREIISVARTQHLVRIKKAKRLWRGWKNEVEEFRSLADRCSAEFLCKFDEGKSLASIPQSVHDVNRFSFANKDTLNALLNDELEAGIIETSDVVAEMQLVELVETENRPSRSGSTAIVEESHERADQSSGLFAKSKPERSQSRKVYPTEAMRNLAVIGHGDAGKTQLISSLLYVAGATPRWGKVDEGTTVTDYDEDSIARKITLNIGLAHLDHRDTKINLIDTPGYAAFVTHARPALRVADLAMVVVDGVKGVEVQTEKTWAYANEFIVPRLMVITKLDEEHSDFGRALETAQNTFSRAIIPFTLPIGKEKGFRGVVDVVHMKAYELGADGQAKEIDIPGESLDLVDMTRERLVELVAESDDALMEKYFEQGMLEESDILPNINKAIAQSKLCPVFAVSAATLVGLRTLLNGIVDYAPNPAHHEAEYGYAEGGGPDSDKIARRYSDSEPFSAYCFRTVADPFAGRINVLKIMSGRLQTDARAYNATRGTMERLGALHTVQGNQLDKVSEAHAGDIVACVMLKETQTGDTICDKQSSIVYPPVEYPEPAIAFAIEPKSRQEEEKISVALHKILEEDQALHFTRDAQTKEFQLWGSGQLHVETVVEKLKKRYGVEVMLHPPKVPYKETITVRAEVQGRYKKQTGGRGQFGDCKVVFEPLPRGSGFVFEDKIFGGAVPQQFRPAIEKGILEEAQSGAIAGYPLVDFKVQLIDGSYHAVDSDEYSFRAAGRKAFRAAMEKVKPSLLEPIMDVEIVAPQENSGDIMADLNSRRGRVQGMEARGKQEVIKAQVPMAEMLNFQSTLNSITAARGSFRMQFSHYDPVPGNLSQKIVEQSRAARRIRGGEEE